MDEWRTQESEKDKELNGEVDDRSFDAGREDQRGTIMSTDKDGCKYANQDVQDSVDLQSGQLSQSQASKAINHGEA